ncbi:hypothetical protein C8R43DRAFT_1109431 [Mycena crocata]|nr:hypothetical protein C8R43DRAFT_1109431 [Mycena crocata]
MQLHPIFKSEEFTFSSSISLDHWLITKALVYGVYIIALVETILFTHDAFATFASGFADLSALTAVHFHWLTVPVMGSLVVYIGQSFYAYRIRVLSKSWMMPASIIVIGFGVAALSDIMIAVCMTYYLLKGNTKIRNTNVLVSRLVRLIIETGSLTAFVALSSLTLWFAFPHGAYFVTPTEIMPPLYANTMLVVLNARFKILGGRATYTSTTEIMSTSASVHFQYAAGPADSQSAN